jgi:type IV secretory pathway TrbF-like protein
MYKEINKEVLSYKPEVEPETAYMRARQEWDNRIGSAVVAAKNWRFLGVSAIALSAMLSVVIIVQSTQSKVIPVIVGIDPDRGSPVVFGKVPESYNPGPLSIKFFLSEFVHNVRSVPLDQVLLRKNWLKSYKFLRKVAADKLNNLAQQDTSSNIKKDGSNIVSVEPISVVQIPDTASYQVRWKETVYNAGDGRKIDEYTMVGTFTVELDAPRDEDQINQNPLGLFIKNFEWNKEL